jgi:hypothetical protein
VPTTTIATQVAIVTFFRNSRIRWPRGNGASGTWLADTGPARIDGGMETGAAAGIGGGMGTGVGTGADNCGSPAAFFFLNGQKPRLFSRGCFGGLTGVSR